MPEIDFSKMEMADLAKAVMHFSAQAAQAQALADAAKRELDRKAGLGLHNFAIHGLKAEIKEQRKFVGSVAKAKLSAAKYKSICVPKPDAARARVLLDEKTFALCQKVYDNTVTVKFLD
jgi:hypothetical protein